LINSPTNGQMDMGAFEFDEHNNIAFHFTLAVDGYSLVVEISRF